MNVQIAPGSQQPNPVSQLALREIRVLSSVLSRALHKEPHLVYLIPEEKMRRAASPRFFEAAIRACRLYGEIYVTHAADGAALWMSPEHNWTIARIVRTGVMGIPFDLEPGIWRRCLRLSASLGKTRKWLAPAAHWYLMVFGAGRSEREETVDAALIEPVLSRADSTGTPCYLETFNEKRLPFYKNHGFRIAGAGRIPGGGPSFWAMIRPAKIRTG